MAFDFPDDPAIGEEYDIYVWDGEKWILATVAGRGIVVEFVELFGIIHPDQLFRL